MFDSTEISFEKAAGLKPLYVGQIQKLKNETLT
jgi:hypothetical protein